MLTVIEILAASVVFMTIIYAETKLLYNYKLIVTGGKVNVTYWVEDTRSPRF